MSNLKGVNSIKFLFLLFLMIISCKSHEKKIDEVFSVINNKNNDCYPIMDDSIINNMLAKATLSNGFTSMQLNGYQLKDAEIFGNEKKYVCVNSKIPPFKKYYLVNNNSAYEVLCYDKGSEYFNDSILDIKGDYLKDVLVYSRMGGNRVGKVYLQSENGQFNKSYLFYNPTFRNSDNSIIGFVRNQSIDSITYKFAWKGYNIDTIEWNKK